MAIDYKRELESAAKTMILVHDHKTLIKMIVRMIVQKVRVRHAGILLHQTPRDIYVLTVSRGTIGQKIPAGFARLDTNNALIRFFREHLDKQLLREGYAVHDEVKKLLRRKLAPATKDTIKGILRQMETFDVEVAISSFFRDELLAILLLGKKKNGKDFARSELDFFVAIASDVAMAIRNAHLFSELASELEKKHRLFFQTTVALAAAIDAKDHYTHGHTARVTSISLAIAKELMKKNKQAVKDNFLEQLHIAALLHDIGKIGVPESILNKEGELTPQEREDINKHPIKGATILQSIDELGDALQGVKYHHEKYDGSGYPDGLKGEQIPIMAAIISVADAFDAMTTNRPYRKAFSKDEAVAEIKRVSGKQLNPLVVGTFVSLYDKGEI